MRLASAQGDKEALKKQLADVERQIENLLDRLVETEKASVVAACEARIDRLEREKLVLSERLEKTAPPKGQLEDCIELALKFLASPWRLYKNGDHAMRQLVLRLAFSRPLRYFQNGMYRTPKFSFLFQILRAKFWLKKNRDGAAGEN
ncbi:hypothetical protein PVW48_03490 [Dinoroseobacter sp. PD6]|uniref:hypothetical protein n=1 Tax=Dinoroseobacter sp. PD6 TaxID=3028384 RepID=UPI00237B9FFB|nr:hypothetical protein [Dinoroseobacter sp. PD6]MDD9715791.1 hypothetical protein [Dinoroseobacter sp. PD6]